MSDGGDGDSFGGGDGEGGAFANSPTYDPSSPVDSPGGSGGGGGTTPPAADDQPQAQAPQEEEAQLQHAPDDTSNNEAPTGDDDDGDNADVHAIWEAVQDDEGRTYYYNTVSGESSWEAPPGFTGGGVGGAASAAAAAADDDDEDGHAAQAQGESTSAPAAAAAAASEAGAEAEAEGQGQPSSSADQPQRWTGYKDDEGRTYYYNEATGETQWERPVEGPTVVVVEEEDMEAEAEAEVDADQKDGASSERMEEGEYVADDGMEVDETRAGVEQVPEEEERKDPRQLALEEAEAALTKTDAVMELDCLDNVAELIDQLGGNVGGPKAMQALVSSNHGLTAVCGLLSLWITELRTTLATSTGESPSKMKPSKKIGGGGAGAGAGGATSSSAAGSGGGSPQDQVRSIAEDIVSRFAREHFSVAKGDNILNLSKSEAAFLEQMIENQRWRRLLIDLSATYKDSALLTYCLKSISKRGHHREIAKRINQSDYFGVFNAMLTSELEYLGMVGIDGSGSSGGSGADGGDADDETPESFDGVISDLRRTCTSTSYTYYYTREVLRVLTARAKAAAEAKDGAEAAIIAKAMRRWARLSEELETAMVLPDESTSAGTSANTIIRKRRLDIALTTSELHQRQRRRMAPNSSAAAPKKSIMRDNLDSAVEKLIRKYSMGVVIDNETAGALLRASYGSEKQIIGDVLNAHPVALSALLAYLFKPGRLRVRSLEMRHKCAKLLALSSYSTSVALSKSGKDVDAAPVEDNVDEFTKTLLRGSQLCEQIETMVSFIVVDEVEFKEGASVGRELSSLCIKNPAVAQGALLWSIERGSSVEFVDSAAYPTLAPSMLTLARIISIHHPLSRPEVQKIALIFLKHSPPELSFQKAQGLKEQALRLLLWLCAQGEAVRVFSAVPSAGFDSALLRYFMAATLQIVRPTFSLPLVRSLGSLLSSKPCVDALRSSHFDVSGKALLAKLLGNFRDAISAQGNLASCATSTDKALVASLTTLYS